MKKMKLYNYINNYIMDKLTFQISDWDSFHKEDDDGNKNYKIRIFGRTRDNDDQSVYLEVDNYMPYFYVEINKAWRQADVDRLLEFLKTTVYPKECANGLVSYKIVQKHDFNGFTNNTLFSYLELMFSDNNALKAYERAFRKKRRYYWLSKDQIKFRIYDSSLDPLLRYMHDGKINAVGWIAVEKAEEFLNDESPTICDINIHADWHDIKLFECDEITKFKLLSFDLECYSCGGFPQAKRDSDEVIQIGMTMSRVGETECYYKHLLSLKKTSPIEGVIVDYFETEKELLLAFPKILRKLDPDLITGYNIFGFDFKYLKKRAKKNGIYNEFSQLSRVKDEISEWIKKPLSSAALGSNMLKFYKMTGRVLIDLMKVVQKDYTNLDFFNLDFVSSYFIKGAINKYKKIENLIEFNVKNVNELKLGHFVSIYYHDIIDDKANAKYVINKIEGDNIYIDFDEKLIKLLDGLDKSRCKMFWCASKDDLPPNEIFKKFKQGPDERAEIGKYCIQDCALCNKLIEKIKTIVNGIGMANVCSVPLSYLFLRGQGIKIFSLMAKECRKENYLIKTKKYKPPVNPDEVKKFEKFVEKLNKNEDNSDSDNDDDADAGYEGALVLPPVTGAYIVPVTVLDYSSLYPSAMIYMNISHESLVIDPKYDNLPDYIYHEVKYKNNDGSETTCRFAEKKTGEKAILPKILIWLLSARKRYKNLMDGCTDPHLKSIYNGMQLAYKVVANSVYGSTGAPTSKIFKKEIAASTTAVGREMLMFAKNFIIDIFAKVLNFVHEDYNDYMEFMVKIYSKIPENKFKKYEKEEDGTFDTKEQYFEHVYDKVKNIIGDYKTDPKIVYGDSVTGDTPILLRKNGTIDIKTIEELGIDWKTYLDEKEQDDNINYEVWTDKGWAPIKRVIRHQSNKKIYEVITNTGYVKVTEDHSLLTENGEQIKPGKCKIGTKLLHSFPESPDPVFGPELQKKYEFYKQNKEQNVDCYCEGQLETMQQYYLYKIHGFGVTIDRRPNNFFLKCRKNELIKDATSIKQIRLVKNTGRYVYDLETTVGHFHAGIGEMIIKNTDSIFYSVNLMEDGKKLTDRKALEKSIKLGVISSQLACGLLTPPMSLEYEKVLWPLLLISKKRYTGNLYEKDPDKFYQKNMGIVLKRRDNAPVVKIICGNIIDQILNKHSKQGAIDYTRKALESIVKGKFDFSKFIITKTLRDNYADRTSIAHAVLADRMAERDLGNKPQINDRIPYAYIETNKKIKLQGERIENPDYIIKNKLKVDYLFYITNQIMKPALQFLELTAENPQDLFKDYIIREENRQKKMIPIEFYMKTENENKSNENKIDLLNIPALPDSKYDNKVKRKFTRKDKPSTINSNNAFSLGMENIQCFFKSSID
jgi:DNA polymerase elongation subunit (family B)